MKKIFFFLALFSTYYGYAQNYQCLQFGVKHYFINKDNYLRGIRIDSMDTVGNVFVYYPYRTIRQYPIYDTAGSWLGKKVVQLPDSTFLFDNIWGDTVAIKTQAATGDTWLFYSDTNIHTYIATVINIDTMTILGVLDSVKDIIIHSYHSGIPDTLDPVNGYSMLLSKNSGFARIFDLYTFPYYSPSGAISEDLYYKYLHSQIFNLVSYHNPTSIEMYHLNVGDMFAGDHESMTVCSSAYLIDYTHYDSIIYKAVIDSFHINYAIHHIASGSYTFYGGPTTTPFTEDYIDTLHADTSLIFLTQMPEECTVSDLVYYYYPSDTTFCHQSPAYMSTKPWIFEGCPFEASFKQGFLPLYDSTACGIAPVCGGDPSQYITITDVMYYALVGGHSCNSVILPPLNVSKVAAVNTMRIFPNPVQKELNITAYNKIGHVTIINVLGQILYNQEFNSERIQIDVSNFPDGLYYVKINMMQVQKFVKM